MAVLTYMGTVSAAGDERPRLSRGGKILIAVASLPLVGLAIVALGDALVHPAHEVRRYTCLQCRLGKRVTATWYSAETDFASNECSEWYSERFPGHEHEWRKYSCTYGREAGRFLWVPRIRVACSEGHPVYDIMWQEQYGLLLSSTDEQRREFFRLLDSGDSKLAAKAVEMAREWSFRDPRAEAE